jgi:muconolactone delta-isomerase
MGTPQRDTGQATRVKAQSLWSSTQLIRRRLWASIWQRTVQFSHVSSDLRLSLTNDTGAVRAGRQYKVRDLWLHQNVGTAVRYVLFAIAVHSLHSKLTVFYRTWNVTLPSHGVAALLLTDDGPEPANETPPCAEPWLAIGNCANYGWV